MSESPYIVMPAYNEAGSIKNTVEEWYPVIEAHDGDGESRLVIVNDGSKDGTLGILKELARTRPLLEPLDKPNGGMGRL